MKKVINVGIGGRSFVIEEDAYRKLRRYLDAFQGSGCNAQAAEVMNDLEERIAELFSQKRSLYKDVIDLEMVNQVIAQMGMPDGEQYDDSFEGNVRRRASRVADSFNDAVDGITGNGTRRLFRKPNSGGIGGVCSGLAIYFNIDTTVMRIIFILLFVFGCSGILIYLILWIAVPKAKSPVDMCQMYGLPITPENIDRFANKL